MIGSIKKQFVASVATKQTALKDRKLLLATEQAVREIINAFLNGKKLLVMGNGGSASQAQHFAGELVSKFEEDRPALPALALTTDFATTSAIANDTAFDYVFSRQIEALGQPGDICLVLTTSDSDDKPHGHSANILHALKAAKILELRTIGLVSQKTERLLEYLDIALVVPSRHTPRIQEVHGLLIHVICKEVERAFV